jgi:amphi-Trp domain-containing protein
MSKREIDLKTQVTTPEVIGLLEDLVHSMKDGKVVVESGEDMVVIITNESVKLELECYQKENKAKLAFELKWSDKSTATDLSNALKISSQEPVITEEPLETEEASETPNPESAEPSLKSEHVTPAFEVEKNT